MGFPVGAETIVLTFGVGLTDGSTGRESITITPSPPQIISTALNDIREGDPVTVVPDRSTGIGQMRLLNTDATGYLPTGWTYKIERGTHPAYFVSLPHSLGATVDLADLTPVSADPGVYDVLLPASELGAAAFLDIGITTDTVAAGDDARFGEIAGIPITGTPAAGKVPTLTSSSAGTWQTPAGGGGGATIRSAVARITDDNLGGLPSASSWAVVLTSASTPLQCSITAAAGDRIEVYGEFMYVGAHFLDWVLLDSGGAIALYSGSGTSSPLAEGKPSLYSSLSFSKATSMEMFTVASGHLSGGMATVALAHQGTASGTVYAHTTYPWVLRLKNIGPEPA